MPTTQDGKPTGARARAEAAEDTKFTSSDTFTNPSIRSLTTTATAEDAQGIERIVIGSTESFTPAPTESTPEQIEAAKKLEKLLGEAKETRTAALKAAVEPEGVKSEDRAANQPGVGGSQEGGVPAKDDNTTSLGGNPDTKGTGNQPAQSDQKKGS